MSCLHWEGIALDKNGGSQEEGVPPAKERGVAEEGADADRGGRETGELHEDVAESCAVDFGERGTVEEGGEGNRNFVSHRAFGDESRPVGVESHGGEELPRTVEDKLGDRQLQGVVEGDCESETKSREEVGGEFGELSRGGRWRGLAVFARAREGGRWRWRGRRMKEGDPLWKGQPAVATRGADAAHQLRTSVGMLAIQQPVHKVAPRHLILRQVSRIRCPTLDHLR